MEENKPEDKEPEKSIPCSCPEHFYETEQELDDAHYDMKDVPDWYEHG